MEQVKSRKSRSKRFRKSRSKRSRKSRLKRSRKSRLKRSRKSRSKRSRKSRSKRARKSRSKRARKSRSKRSRKSRSKRSRKLRSKRSRKSRSKRSRKSKRSNEREICPICHKYFNKNNEVKSMCLNRHKFHEKCINQMIDTGNFNCHVCGLSLLSDGILWENYEINEFGKVFFRYKNKNNKYIRRYISSDSMIVRGHNGIIDIVVMFSLPDHFYGRNEEEIELTANDIIGNDLNTKCKTLANINKTSVYEITPVKNVYIDSSIWSRLNTENIKLFLINFKRIFIFEIREFEVIQKNDDGKVKKKIMMTTMMRMMIMIMYMCFLKIKHER